MLREFKISAGLQINKDIFEDLFTHPATNVRIASSTLKDFVVFDRIKSIPILFSTFINNLGYDGVSIQILTTPKMLGSRFFYRLSKNIEVKACARNHLKLICLDNKFGYIGTANLTSAAVGLKSTARRNFEVGFITSDTKVMALMTRLFDEIWTGINCHKCVYMKRKTYGCLIHSNSNKCSK
jgi:phosphatidylserine/phosphatidylglycerophosphate/cardiolipin synthase-like enzyme